MSNFKFTNKGVALLVVLGTIFIVVVLANIALRVMLSQSRFTHHKVSRIQAQYAGWAAINYAQEELRTGNWSAAICGAAGCALPPDSNIPNSILQPIMITLIPFNNPGCTPAAGVPAGTTCISVQVQYTSQ
jgi:Tfp pilus assembly protein PilX